MFGDTKGSSLNEYSNLKKVDSSWQSLYEIAYNINLSVARDWSHD